MTVPVKIVAKTALVTAKTTFTVTKWTGKGVLATGKAVGKIISAPFPDNQMKGVASWYGPGFDGKLTASGKIYDRHALTAAHKTLALGTKIKVKNLENGRSVVVIINDRGPFIKGRIIDLSHEAAKRIAILEKGTARVKLKVLD